MQIYAGQVIDPIDFTVILVFTRKIEAREFIDHIIPAKLEGQISHMHCDALMLIKLPFTSICYLSKP